MVGMKGFLGAAAVTGVLLAAGSAHAITVVKWNTCDGTGNNSNPGKCTTMDAAPVGNSAGNFSITESPRFSTGSGNNKVYTADGYIVSNPSNPNHYKDIADDGDASTTGPMINTLDPTRDLIVRAFRSQGNDGSNSKATAAEVNGPFDGGLGVKSPSQNSGVTVGQTYMSSGSDEGNSPNHAVDNIGFDEFLVFEFGNDDYIPLSFMIGWANKNTGVDIITYIGGAFGDGLIEDLATGDIGLGDLVALGFVEEAFTGANDVEIGESVKFTKGASGRYLIVAANTGETEQSTSYTDWFQISSYSDCNATKYLGTSHQTTSSSGKKYCKYKPLKDKGDDAFKVTQVIGQLAPPRDNPEPATMGLLALGLAGMGYAARRRKAA